MYAGECCAILFTYIDEYSIYNFIICSSFILYLLYPGVSEIMLLIFCFIHLYIGNKLLHFEEKLQLQIFYFCTIIVSIYSKFKRTKWFFNYTIPNIISKHPNLLLAFLMPVLKYYLFSERGNEYNTCSRKHKIEIKSIIKIMISIFQLSKAD